MPATVTNIAPEHIEHGHCFLATIPGAHLGSGAGEVDAFRADMHAFWQRVLPLHI